MEPNSSNTADPQLILMLQTIADAIRSVGEVTNAQLNLLSAIASWVQSGTSANFTSVTTIATIQVTIPKGCTKLKVEGKMRVQSQVAGNVDMQAFIDYDNGLGTAQSGATSIATSNATFGSSMLPFTDIFTVTEGLHNIRIRAQAGGNTQASYGQLHFTPVKA